MTVCVKKIQVMGILLKVIFVNVYLFRERGQKLFNHMNF